MQLSICMPSNRDFAQSRQAIETALAYCTARDAVLILGDNSGDAAKRSHWKGCRANLSYLDTQGTDATGNFTAVFRHAATPFVLPMGDDDELLADPAFPAFDLASLPADHIGVRPVTQVWAPGRGTLRTKTYAIAGATPDERIMEYNKAAQGENSAFYSIFRRQPYVDMMELFGRYHPTKGSYSDWAQVYALFTYGKMALDRGTIFRYNNAGWLTQEDIDRKNISLYTSAGFPADAVKYAALLQHLDLFVLVSSRTAPFTQEERLNAVGIAGNALTPFLSEVRQAPHNYNGTVQYLVELAEQERNPVSRFQIALVMANQLQDGLKDRYIDYYRAATGL